MVSGTSSGADSIGFPDGFRCGVGGSGARHTGPTRAWSTDVWSAELLSFAVTATNTGVQSDPVSFTVSADSVAPVSSITCGGVARSEERRGGKRGGLRAEEGATEAATARIDTTYRRQSTTSSTAST